MKNFKIFFTVSVIVVLSVRCKKQMMSYEGINGVYFAVQSGSEYLNEDYWPYQPNSVVSFVKYNDTSDIIYPVKVRLTGPVTDYDRYFNVAVNPDSTTAKEGVHYKDVPTQVTMPADSTTAYVNVHLIRTPDLETTEVKLGLRLIANKYFGLSFPHWDALPELTSGTIVEHFDASLHTLYINDFLVQPAGWLGSIQNGNRESGLFGAFTRKKLDLMTQVTGVTYADFLTTESMPLVKAMLIASEMSAYLIDKYNAGTPILEDDGRLMWLGTVPWTSYIGVPWVPGK